MFAFVVFFYLADAYYYLVVEFLRCSLGDNRLLCSDFLYFPTLKDSLFTVFSGCGTSLKRIM